MKRLQLLRNSLNIIQLESLIDPVLFLYDQKVVNVILNREKALNSINNQMCIMMNNEMKKWNDPQNNIQLIIFQGKGKAFSAGGDIKASFKLFNDNKQIDIVRFLDIMNIDEYGFYYNTSVLKPIRISIFDGIIMGGGVGAGIYSDFRVATENTKFSMPEAKIGFFCDTGASYFYGNLRNKMGIYLGLTGKVLNGKEILMLGLADFYIKSQDIVQMNQELKKIVNENNLSSEIYKKEIKQILKKYSLNIEEQELDYEKQVQKLFDVESYQQLIENLQKDESEFSKKTLEQLNQQCPLSLRTIFQMMKNPCLTIKESLQLDFRLAHWFQEEKEFFEGVRTVLVNRNDTPNWKYKDPLQIDQKLIDKMFYTKFDLEDDFLNFIDNQTL